MSAARHNPNIHEVSMTVADFRWKGEIESARLRMLSAREINPLGVADDPSEFLSIDEHLEFHWHLRCRFGVRPTTNPPIDRIKIAHDVRVVTGVETCANRASGKVNAAVGHPHGDLMVLTVVETHPEMHCEAAERRPNTGKGHIRSRLGGRDPLDDDPINDHVERDRRVRLQRVEGPPPQDPPIKAVKRADNARRQEFTAIEPGCRDLDTVGPPIITGTLTKARKGVRLRLP